MTLIPRDNWPNIDRFFQDFGSPMPNLISAETRDSFFAPRVDIKDTGNSFEISAEVPGVKKDDISISLHNGVLNIEAESKQEDKEEKDGRIIRQERRYGKWVRSFTVGDSISETDIHATLEDGILKIVAPKAQPEEPEPKNIPVR